MSWPEVEGKWRRDSGDGNSGNVVPLQTAANGTDRPVSGAREACRPAPEAISHGAGRDDRPRDCIARDGLDLLRAFFAIADAPARAAVLLMAQRLASQTGKR